VSKKRNRRIGCDLVPLGSFSERTNRFVFHPEELEAISEDRSVADHLWAVKEAVYKATCRDRPFSPLHWIVRRSENNTFLCRSAEFANAEPVVVHTRLHDGHVLAVAVVDP